MSSSLENDDETQSLPTRRRSVLVKLNDTGKEGLRKSAQGLKSLYSLAKHVFVKEKPKEQGKTEQAEAMDADLDDTVKSKKDLFYAELKAEMMQKAMRPLQDEQLYYFRLAALNLMGWTGPWLPVIPMLGLILLPRHNKQYRFIHAGYAVVLQASLIELLRALIDFKLPRLFGLVYLLDQVLCMEQPVFLADLGLFYLLLFIQPSLLPPPKLISTFTLRSVQFCLLFYLSPLLLYPALLAKKAWANPPTFKDKLAKMVRMGKQGVRMSWDATTYLPA